MLQIQDLRLIHDKDFRVLIDGLTFAVNPGDKIVVIGEEGEGKSTLLKWIYDPSLIEGYAEAEGARITGGEKPGYLPQELPQEARDLTVYGFMCAEELFSELDPPEISGIAREVGLSPEMLYSDQAMGTLSGGEKVKVMLARVLAARPTILLLDEPSNDIDIETLEWLEGFINRSREGILFVSHDETLIERTANRVIHIEQLEHKTVPRHTVANVPYREYVTRRSDAFIRQETRARSEQREQREAEERWRRIYRKVEHDQSSISRGDPHGGRLLKKKMHSVKSQGRRLEKQRENMTELPHSELAINLGFSYTPDINPGRKVISIDIPVLEAPDGSRVLAGNVRLEVRGPGKICITGRNGAGKTTLLRKIAEDLAVHPTLKSAYMPQNYEDVLDMESTPAEFLTRGGGREERVLINNRLASLRFTPDDMNRKIGELSGGQRAKLILLSLTLSGADVLLLDEPTRNFSPLSGPVVRNMLRGFPGALISVSHDRKFIEEVAETVYELDESGIKIIKN